MVRQVFVRSFLLAALLLVFVAPGASAFGQLGGVNMVGGGPDAANFQLDTPTNIVSVADGSYFVLDTGNSRVLRINSSGQLMYAFGGPGSGAGRIQSPSGIATVGGGASPDVLVAQGLGQIKRFSATGTELASFGTLGTADGQFSNLRGIVVDPSCGELFAVDVPNSGGGRIQRFALGDAGPPAFGTHLQSFGVGSGFADKDVPGKLWYPRNIAVSPDGQRIFVADTANFRVQTFTWTGNCTSRTFAYETLFGSKGASQANFLENPTSVAVDASTSPARIYVTNDYLENVVKLFTAGSNAADPSAGPYSITGTQGSGVDPVAQWGTIISYGSVPPEGPNDLGAPNSVVASGSNVLVTEATNNRIHRYGNVSAASPFVAPTTLGFWGQDSRDDGFFKSPEKVSAASDGGFFVSDPIKYRIQRFSASGDFVSGFGSYDATGIDGTFNGSPGDVAVAPDDTVYVADPGNGRLQHFTSGGAHLGNVVGPSGFSPGALDIDSQGKIWVYDWDDHVVRKLDTDGTALAAFGTDGMTSDDDTLYMPSDLVVSADGLTVHVLDSNRSWIKKFTSTDGVGFSWAATSASGLGSGDGQLKYPYAIDQNPVTGDLAVADSSNDRVELLNPDFSFDSKFGSYGFGSANLINPQGVAYDTNGNLWVSDRGNDSVKRYGDAPEVTLGALPTTTTDNSVVVSFTTSDPAASCDQATGASVNLAIGVNSISVTCTNAQGSGVGSFSITRTHIPPVVAITAPSETTTTAPSVNVAYTVNGGTSFPAGTTCTVDGNPSSDTQANSRTLDIGANTISVTCSNSGGTHTATASITRVAPPALAAPGDPSIVFPKKLKLSRSGKLAFTVTCPAACTVQGSLRGPRLKKTLKSVTLSKSDAAQKVTLTLSKRLAKQVRAALKAKRRVKLTVTATAKGAKQGKSGSAILKK